MRAALAGLLIVASCRREVVATRPNDPDARRSEADAAELPRVRVLADIAEHHGKRAVVEALYEVEPIARGKGGRRVWLVLVDGTRISRAYDAVVAELPYANRRVLATGVITSGPPDRHVQALLSPHLAVEKLELAIGEPPLDRSAHDLPVPPVASSMPTLATEIDRWVQVVGTLGSLTGDLAKVELADGGAVRVEHVQVPEWAPHVGSKITVLGRLAMEKGAGSPFALDLVLRGPTAICAGAVAKCGM